MFYTHIYIFFLLHYYKMKYRYPPIVKYGLLLISIFMFIKYLKLFPNEQILMLTVSIVAMVILFDYVLINDHMGLIGNVIFEDFEDDTIISDIDIDEIIEKYDKKNDAELDNDEELEYPSTSASNQLPIDHNNPSFDLNNDCYRRGDGNKNVARFYDTDVM